MEEIYSERRAAFVLAESGIEGPFSIVKVPGAPNPDTPAIDALFAASTEDGRHYVVDAILGKVSETTADTTTKLADMPAKFEYVGAESHPAANESVEELRIRLARTDNEIAVLSERLKDLYIERKLLSDCLWKKGASAIKA